MTGEQQVGRGLPLRAPLPPAPRKGGAPTSLPFYEPSLTQQPRVAPDNAEPRDTKVTICSVVGVHPNLESESLLL